MALGLSWLRAAPAAPLIADREKQERCYQYWRMRILYATFIGYALYYFTRGTLAIAMPELKRLGFGEAQLGWMLTLFQVMYGLSRMCNGILADRANPRFFMGLGLMGTGVITILFGISHSLLAFAVLWTLHGWFQACGSAPCHRLMTYWYSKPERGRWWSIWNSSHNLGAAILPPFGAFLLVRYGWESVMLVPGVLALAGGLFLINRLRDTPRSLGLPSIEEFHGRPEDEKQDDAKLPLWELLNTYILRNPALWVLAVVNFMVYVVRCSLMNWTFFYLVEVELYEPWIAAQCLWWYEAAGFAGGLAAGWISDLLFNGRRTPVHLLFMTGVVASMWGFHQLAGTGAHSAWIQMLMGAIGFFVYGPQMLLCVHAVEVSHKRAAATSVGFLGVVAYMGAAMTGGPLGHVAQTHGWDFVFWLVEICAIIGLAAVASLYLLRGRGDAPHHALAQ